MKKAIFVIGLVLFTMGFVTAQDQQAISKKVAEGNTNTPFGRYTVEVQKATVMFDGEQVTSYKISYEKSPVSVTILVDKEQRCKNYIVVSDGLSIMYTCNGKYFGVNKVDKKYNKEGYVTEDTNLDKTNFYHQKLLANGAQEELAATALIASYFPSLLK